MTRVCVEILDETHRFIEEMARNRGWSVEEAVRTMVDEGMASIRAGEVLPGIEGLPDAEKVTCLLVMLKDADSAYASLRFQNYLLVRDKKTLEMNLTGYKSECESLKKYVNELRREIGRLKTPQEKRPPG